MREIPASVSGTVLGSTKIICQQVANDFRFLVPPFLPLLSGMAITMAKIRLAASRWRELQDARLDHAVGCVQMTFRRNIRKT